jgi:dolichol-phosphate mannosyltransferase
MDAFQHTLIIVPTYNEGENLPRLMDAIFEVCPAVNLLVVDDGSPDGTGAMADQRAAEEMDADFSHQPKYLPVFLEAAQRADLVLGCRYIPGGGTVDWTPMRKLISQGGNLYARVALGLPYKDLTGGFKCFRREVLEAIDLDAVASVGYAFQIELTYRAHKRGFRIEQVPIIFPDRQAGESKMSGNIVREAMVNVVKLRFSRTI